MPTYNIPANKVEGVSTLPAADWNSSATAVNDLGTIVDTKSDTSHTHAGGGGVGGTAVYEPSAFTTTAISTAISSANTNGGGKVWCPPGTYVDDGSVTLRSNVILEFAPGALISMPTRATDSYVVSGAGTLGTALAVDGSLAIGAQTITLTATTGLAAGDLCMLTSTEPHNPERGQDKGEFVWIQSISGLVVTVQGAIVDSYNDVTYPASLTKITPLRNVTLRNVKIVGGGLGLNQTGLRIQNAHNVVFEDVVVDGVDKWACNLDTIEGLHVRGGQMLNTRDTDDLLHGFGYFLQNVANSSIEGVYGRANHHLVDVSGYDGRPVSRNVIVDSCVAVSSVRTPFATHGAAEFVTFSNCHVAGGNGGFNIRANGCKIIGCTVQTVQEYTTATNGYPFAVWVGDYTGWTWGKAIGGIDLTITGNTFDMSAAVQNHDTVGINLTTALERAQITNNTIRGFNQNAIRVLGHHIYDSMISGNIIDCGNQRASTSDAIRIELGASDATKGVVANLSVDDNTFVGCRGNPLDLRDGGGSSTGLRNSLRFRRNTITGTPTAPIINLNATGSYFTDTHVTDNIMAGVALANVQNFDLTKCVNMVLGPNHTSDGHWGIVGAGAAAPTAGTWRVGDVWSNTAPSAGGTWCWVCTVSGTPGIWSAFTLN